MFINPNSLSFSIEFPLFFCLSPVYFSECDTWHDTQRPSTFLGLKKIAFFCSTMLSSTIHARQKWSLRTDMFCSAIGEMQHPRCPPTKAASIVLKAIVANSIYLMKYPLLSSYPICVSLCWLLKKHKRERHLPFQWQFWLRLILHCYRKFCCWIWYLSLWHQKTPGVHLGGPCYRISHWSRKTFFGGGGVKWREVP